MRGTVKRALVTGGSGGIGAAVCRRLASDGCHVSSTARSRFAQAEKLAAEIVAKGGSAAAVAFDVADPREGRSRPTGITRRRPHPDRGQQRRHPRRRR